MFKNKKNLYILVPVNVFVWGFIGYKIIAALSGDDLGNTEELTFNYAKISTTKKADSITLALNYKDPFLKEVIHPRPANVSDATGPVSKENKKAGPVITKSVAPVPSSEIKYLGLIQNSSTGAITALISLNAKSYVVKKGDVVEGFLVKSVDPEKLEIKNGKEILVIKK